MKALRLSLGALLLASISLLGASAPATAAPSGTTTYHGSFTGVSYDSDTALASGEWTVVWRGDDVVAATFNIFVAGKHHIAYGLPGPVVTAITPPPNWSFSIPIDPTVSPNPLVVTLADGQLTYVMHDYTWGSDHYNVVTYSGTVS